MQDQIKEMAPLLATTKLIYRIISISFDHGGKSSVALGHDYDQLVSIVYESREKGLEQIISKVECMNIGANELYLYDATDIEDMLVKIQSPSLQALMVDSVQTVYSKEVVKNAGISQSKECTTALLQFVRKTFIPVLLVRHVTKSGDITRPHDLEHIVDVVLYPKGEKCSSHHLLRLLKNHFRTVDEQEIFEMAQLVMLNYFNLH
ncbi:hypothetical protein GQ457_08G033800 [Hibiscus cannabinus]